MESSGVPGGEAGRGLEGSGFPAAPAEAEAAAPSPTWAELTALPPSSRSGPRIGGFSLIFMLGALAIVAVVAGLLFTFASERGQVMFTTTDPNGGNACIVTNKVTAIDRGTHAWVVVVFKRPVGQDHMSIQFRQNGAYVWAYTWPSSEKAEQGSCTWGEDLATYDPGTWTFTVLRNGTVEEEGTITIR